MNKIDIIARSQLLYSKESLRQTIYQMMFDQGKVEKRKFPSLMKPPRGVIALQIVFRKCQHVPVVRTQCSLVVVN